MKFKLFIRAAFQFLKVHPKLYILASVIILVPAVVISSVVIVRSAKKKPVNITVKDVITAPILPPEPTEEIPEEEEKTETNIQYNGQTVVVPKKVVAKIDSKEDPVNTARTMEQPKVQPKTQNDIKTDTFDNIAYGIDVSSHQGNIDWKKVKASGVEFVMIRCGYRGYETGKIVVDAKFENNISNAYKNGIKIGIYFYSAAKNTTETVQEAAWVDTLLKEQKRKGINITYPVAYDFEEFGAHPTSRANGLSKMQVTDNAIAFLDYLESKGYNVLHYSCKAWMLNKWDASRLKKYNFWLAHYCEATDYKGSYVMWQYTSQGRVNGISGDVDLDISGIKASENDGRATFAVCAKDDVSAYEKPNTSSKVLYHLSGDTIYECLKTHEKDWSEFYIYPDGGEKGIYVYVKDSDIKEPEFLSNDNEYETTEKISYYSKAIDKKANIVGEIEKDTKLHVLGVYKKLWIKIEYNNNTYYVKFLNIKETEKQTEPPDTPAETVDNPPETETNKKEVE